MTSSNTNNNTSVFGNKKQLSTSNSPLSVDDSMFLDTDLIHQGITDDDLDLLLSSSIKSENNPPKNLSPAEFPETNALVKDINNDVDVANDLVDIDALEVDDLVAVEMDDSELSLVDDGLLDLDEIDEVLDSDYGLDASTTELSLIDDADEVIADETPELVTDELVPVDSSVDSEDEVIDLITPLPTDEPVSTASVEAEIVEESVVQDIENPESDELELTQLVSSSEQSNLQDNADVSIDDSDLSNGSVTELTLDTSESFEDNQELETVDHDVLDIELPQATNQTVTIPALVVDSQSEIGTTETTQPEPDKFVALNEDMPINDISSQNALSDDVLSDDATGHDAAGSNTQDLSSITSSSMIPATLVASSTKEEIINKNEGNITMTDNTQATIIEKVQVDIDELKRKLHSMNSDFYNAATDSAALISLVRELETGSSNDFAGTYAQSRELRRILVEARKTFNQLASGIDMLEESLETDLFEVQRKG